MVLTDDVNDGSSPWVLLSVNADGRAEITCLISGLALLEDYGMQAITNQMQF